MPAYVLEIVTLSLGLILLVAEVFLAPSKKRYIGYGAIIGLAFTLCLLPFVCGCGGSTPFWSFYTDDKLALFYKGLALICTIIVLILSLDYVPVLERYVARAGGGPAIGEFFALPVFICTGMMWMASATDLSSIFVSLELITIAFYIMVAFQRKNKLSLEAGTKYLVLGALSTGFLVYGIAWLFGVTGQTNLTAIQDALARTEHKTAALFALSLILVGLSFKVAAVPFQFWVPDVYQGAASPVTAFLSVGSKSAGFIVAYRLLSTFLGAPALHGTTTHLLVAIACATLLVGNLAAIPQTNFKRLLAYSSISHAGFLLLALGSLPQAMNLSPIQVVSFYLATYLVMTLLAFAVLGVVQRVTGSDDFTAFDGLSQRSPLLAFAMLMSAISLAGVPLTAGFQGKMLVFALAVDAGHIWPVVIAVIGAVAGFYYYFKIIRSMYWHTATDTTAITLSPLTTATIIALIAATIILGLYPAGVMSLLSATAR
jgi:NADH-quinone oxidoreductase subunit N